MKNSENIFYVALSRDHAKATTYIRVCNFSYLYLHFTQDLRDKRVQAFQITNNDNLLTIVVVNVSK